MDLVFVHGTGVRRAAYDASYKKVMRRLSSHGPTVRIRECCWGDSLGARLNAGGASIPDYDRTKALGGASDTDQDIALWQMLMEDPLFELRVIANAPVEGSSSFGRLSEGEELRERLQSVQMTPPLESALEANELTPHFSVARERLNQDAAFGDALVHMSDSGEQRAAVGRALVALSLALRAGSSAESVPPVDTGGRDLAVEEIIAQLGATPKSIAGFIARQLAGLAVRAGALNFAVRKRGAITDATYAASGDILLYQSAAGAAIRDFIQARIEGAAAPVVVLAHSLGGIASVDLLAMHSLPQVALLVTAGSQAPYLYEINALHSLRYGEPLPDHFPPWLNLYDLRDLLSFTGGRIFGDRVEDVRVDNGLAFPYAHSGYWANTEVWSAIVRRLPS